ncbi:nucleoid-associated protein [Rhizobium sp. S163]|uniref:nucleoid-associated protein n=1 Tax=Rhizobium sp. S163 TaxID=3055039 RepID=UPI0025A93F85|nr:nucleoid-associated protein [Rhizobium sp. S163]MDM9645509.1 nucleoid-associated protein [Rhizobium sp. S163]
MGFFTEQELLSLRIDSMILHVVGDVEFEAQNARPVEHQEFFLGRIRDTNASPIFEFDPESSTKKVIERIASGAESFELGSQKLSREFAKEHDGTSKPGAFFVFQLSSNEPSARYFSLIKYDYQQAIEQSRGEAGNLLRLIVQAFVAQKKAVQKSALVRVLNGTADALMTAADRISRGPDIADYFAQFLHVKRTRSDAELNQRVRDVIRETLQEVRDLLPDRDVARAFSRAKATLRDRAFIDRDAISEAVIAASDAIGREDFVIDVGARLDRKMRSAKLDGLSFPPDRKVLCVPAKRKVTTAEGVTITYPDEADVNIVDRRELPGGGEIITIKTARVMEDVVVRETSKQAGR